MKKEKILVIGSSNTDMVIKSPRFPHPGETIIGGTFYMNQGGKGANQAVAVARLGGDVDFICKTGNDLFREQSVRLYESEGLPSDLILRDKSNPSGVAMIIVDDGGENSIVVASGSNGNLSGEDIDGLMEVLDRSDYILMQLEIPLSTVEHVVSLASKKQKRVILNPAPAAELPLNMFRDLYMITPNVIEAEYLTGIQIKDEDSLVAAARELYNKGVQHVIITLGGEGVLVYNGEFEKVPAEKAEPVDTTGAGDVFNGALCVALSEGKSLVEAVKFANKAAAISITKNGAIPSIPRREEL